MRRRSLHFIAAMAIAVFALTPAFLIGQQSPRQLFERAKIVEEANTDLKQAIRLYEQAIAQSEDRALTAEALLRVGGCYEKLGNDADAQKTYQRVIREFGNQKDAVTQANLRLGALGRSFASDTPSNVLVKTEDPLGPARHVLITPNGRFMSMRLPGPQGAVVLRDMRTGQSTRFTRKDADAVMISPDGSRIARVHAVGRGYELLVQDNKPKSKPVVVLNADTQRSFYLAAWTKDNKSILLTRENPDLTWEIDWLSLADPRPKRIVSLGWRLNSDDRPSLSPDGRYIAYSALTNNPAKPLDFRPAPPDTTSIYVLAVDGSTEKPVVTGESINEAPIWAPDGKHILFVSNRASGHFGLYSVAVENGNAKNKPAPVRGVAIEERIRPVGMTQSGSYYYVKEQTGTDVFQTEIGPDGKSRGQAVLISDNGVGHNFEPSWSPDGKRIAFKRERSTGMGEDLIIRSENGEERPFNLMDKEFLGWMHDSKSLLLGTFSKVDQRTSLEVYRFDLSTEAVTSLGLILTPPSFDFNGSVLSSDDRTIYLCLRHQLITAERPPRVVSIDTSVVSFDLTSKTQREIWSVSKYLDSPKLSPDGRALALRAGDSLLARVGVDGTGYTELIKSPSVRYVVGWSPEGRAIFFMDRDRRLMRVSSNGGIPDFTGLTFENNVALKPNGSQILSDRSYKDELWKLDSLTSVLEDSGAVGSSRGR